MIEDFFWYLVPEFEEEVETVVGFLLENKEKILEFCRKIDRDERMRVSWDQLSSVLAKVKNLEPRQAFIVKNLAFKYEENLFGIPYETLFKDLLN